MFQLLMGGHPEWPANNATVGRGRVFEFTDADVLQRLWEGGVPGQLNLGVIRSIPAIFAGVTDRRNRATDVRHIGASNR